MNDDIYFCLSDDGTTGYFSSERPSGLGSQDIYQVIFPGSQIDYVAVLGVITNDHAEPIRARLTVTDVTGEEIIGVFNSNARTGRYLLILKPGGQYKVSIDAEGFETRETEISAHATVGTHERPLDITLVRNESTAGATQPQ